MCFPSSTWQAALIWSTDTHWLQISLLFKLIEKLRWLDQRTDFTRTGWVCANFVVMIFQITGGNDWCFKPWQRWELWIHFSLALFILSFWNLGSGLTIRLQITWQRWPDSLIFQLYNNQGRIQDGLLSLICFICRHHILSQQSTSQTHPQDVTGRVRSIPVTTGTRADREEKRRGRWRGGGYDGTAARAEEPSSNGSTSQKSDNEHLEVDNILPTWQIMQELSFLTYFNLI